MQKKYNLSVPQTIDFSDLKLHRDPDGSVSFNIDTIRAVCNASGIDPRIFFDTHEDNIAELIIAWYSAHLKNGGTHDAVADDLISEAIAENDLGYGISHKPGRA